MRDEIDDDERTRSKNEGGEPGCMCGLRGAVMTETFGQKAHARQQLLRTDTLGGVNSNGEAGKRDRIRFSSFTEHLD